jgi:hypothetical protein
VCGGEGMKGQTGGETSGRTEEGVGTREEEASVLGGSKGKVVRAGEVVTDVNRVRWKVEGRFKPRGRRGCFLVVKVSFSVCCDRDDTNEFCF